MADIPSFNLQRQYATIVQDIEARVNKVLSSGRYILSGEVEAFEKDFAALEQVKHAIGVASGSDALVVALMALGIQPGDEVITTPFTFFATASSASRLGATPVFVDVREDTYNIDETKLEAAITPKTKAIVVVHLYGQMCAMDTIMQIAEKHGIPVIEDAAQAVQASYDGKHSGAYGAMATYSFYPTKNLGAFGDGGMITTNDPEIDSKIRILRAHGSATRYYHDFVGVNSRLDEIQAAILNVKMQYLSKWIARRQEIASLYSEKLGAVSQVTCPVVDPKAEHVFHQYTIRCENRDALQQHLKENGIGSTVYYPVPLQRQTCFLELGQEASCPVSDVLAKEVLSLPMFPELTDEEVLTVVSAIAAFYD